MRALPLFHRVAGKPVIVVGTGEAAEAKRRLVERAGGIVVTEADPAARLAFIALDEPGEAAERLRARGLLVNVVDRPELCDFTVPSLLDRDPVLIAVGSAGVSAGLAKHVRLRLDRIIPAALGKLANALHAARPALQRRWPEASDRRHALDDALAEGSVLDPFSEGAEQRVSAWAAGSDVDTGSSQPDAIIVSSNDPDDLTLRQARLLGAADAVVFDRGVAPAILDRARADAVRIAADSAQPRPAGRVVIVRRA